MYRVVSALTALDRDLVYCDVETGVSLLEVIGAEYDQLYVLLNDTPIPKEEWGNTYPVDGDIVGILRVPGFFGIDIAAALSAAAISAGTSGIGGALGGAVASAIGGTVGGFIGLAVGLTVNLGISMGLSMAISALVKPQIPSASGRPASRYYSISGANNDANPYGPIPKLYGTFRMAPKLAAPYYITTYTTASVSEKSNKTAQTTETLHALMCIGHGPVRFMNNAGDWLTVGSDTWYNPNTREEEPVTGRRQIIEGGKDTGNEKKNTRQGQTVLDQSAIMVGNTPVNLYNEFLWQIGIPDAVLNPKTYDLRTGTKGDGKDASRLYADKKVITRSYNLPFTPNLAGTITNNIYAQIDKYANIVGDDGAEYIRVTEPDAVKVRVFISFPTGLYQTFNTTQYASGVGFKIGWRKAGSKVPFKFLGNSLTSPDERTYEGGYPIGSWTWDSEFKGAASGSHDYRFNAAVINYATGPITCCFSLKIDDNDRKGGDQYEVYIKRTMTIIGKYVGQHAWVCNWVSMQSIIDKEAWNTTAEYLGTTKDVLLMAIKVPASEQLSGNLDTVAVAGQSVLRATGNGTDFEWIGTGNPAWVYADLLQGCHLPKTKRLKDDRIDWQALINWALWCEQSIPSVGSPDGPPSTPYTGGGTDARPPTNPGDPTLPIGGGDGPLPGGGSGGGTDIRPPDNDPNYPVTLYNWYHLDEETLLDRLRAVTSCGRATWALTDAKFSVIRDTNFEPVQMISGRNSSGFEMSKTFPLLPHALRVRYISTADYQQAEKIVLDDYYYTKVPGPNNTTRYEDAFGRDMKDITNWPDGTTQGEVDAAFTGSNPLWKEPQVFEVLETQGVVDELLTTPEFPKGKLFARQAFREGRYYLAVARLRNETYKLSMDIENLIANRGDCVLLSQECILVSRATGRITKVTSDTEFSTDILVDLTPDDPVSEYCVQIRRADNTYVIYTLTLGTGPTTRLQVTEALSGVGEGDLFVFGVKGTESILAKITNIDYKADLSAELTLVPAAPEIQGADQGMIGGYDPVIDPGGVEEPGTVIEVAYLLPPILISADPVTDVVGKQITLVVKPQGEDYMVV